MTHPHNPPKCPVAVSLAGWYNGRMSGSLSEDVSSTLTPAPIIPIS